MPGDWHCDGPAPRRPGWRRGPPGHRRLGAAAIGTVTQWLVRKGLQFIARTSWLYRAAPGGRIAQLAAVTVTSTVTESLPPWQWTWNRAITGPGSESTSNLSSPVHWHALASPEPARSHFDSGPATAAFRVRTGSIPGKNDMPVAAWHGQSDSRRVSPWLRRSLDGKVLCFMTPGRRDRFSAKQWVLGSKYNFMHLVVGEIEWSEIQWNRHQHKSLKFYSWSFKNYYVSKAPVPA